MRIVIFTGETPSTIMDTGLDLGAETFGNPADADLFERGSSLGKRFPGGPNCEFNGVTVP